MLWSLAKSRISHDGRDPTSSLKKSSRHCPPPNLALATTIVIQPAVRKGPNATASRQIFHDLLRPLPSLRISLHTTHTSVYSTHISREPQPTHQSAVYASVYNLWISLQPTHPSTVYALIYSLRIRLQHTHPSAAKSIYSIHISINIRISLQSTHQSVACA